MFFTDYDNGLNCNFATNKHNLINNNNHEIFY